MHFEWTTRQIGQFTTEFRVLWFNSYCNDRTLAIESMFSYFPLGFLKEISSVVVSALIINFFLTHLGRGFLKFAISHIVYLACIFHGLSESVILKLNCCSNPRSLRAVIPCMFSNSSCCVQQCYVWSIGYFTWCSLNESEFWTWLRRCRLDIIDVWSVLFIDLISGGFFISPNIVCYCSAPSNNNLSSFRGDFSVFRSLFQIIF